MAILAVCWLIVESRVIPDGFVKWFFLSFYIHPFLLIFCQIFLWLNLLLLQPLLSLLSFLRKPVAVVVSDDYSRAEKSEQAGSCSTPAVGVVNSYSCCCTESKLVVVRLDQRRLEGGSEGGAGSRKDEEDAGGGGFIIASPSPPPSSLSSPAKDDGDDELVEGRQPTDRSLSSCSLLERETDDHQEEEEEEEEEGVCVDAAFYEVYVERMRWFDRLNHDRTSGASALLNKQVELCNESPFRNIELHDEHLPSPFESGPPLSKTDKQILIKSMENDFELVYVAQSCLSWEALLHQYKKLESLASQESNNVLHCGAHNVGQQFQKFEVLLERFMEDERCHGKRVWNYVSARFALDTLLQVPRLSVTFDKEGREEGTLQAKEVLNILERCIKTFWTFVTTDVIEKRPWWKLSRPLLSSWCLEDPMDASFLYDLTEQFRKKEKWLRDLQGKRRCWLKKMKSTVEEECEKKEIMFTLIEMKLISRVLRLPVITTCQLKWCSEKLDMIECRDGKVVRHNPPGYAFLLFPP